MSEGLSQWRTADVRGIYRLTPGAVMAAEAWRLEQAEGWLDGRKQREPADSVLPCPNGLVSRSPGPRSSFRSRFIRDFRAASPAHSTFAATHFRSPVSPPVEPFIEGYANTLVCLIILLIAMSCSSTALGGALEVGLGQCWLTVVSQNLVQSWHMVGHD